LKIRTESPKFEEKSKENQPVVAADSRKKIDEVKIELREFDEQDDTEEMEDEFITEREDSKNQPRILKSIITRISPPKTIEKESEIKTREISSEERTRRKKLEQDKDRIAVLNKLWKSVANHQRGRLFLEALNEKEAPNYSEIIKQPIDLKIIKTKLDHGEIKNGTELYRDLLLMVTNFVMYWPKESPNYKAAFHLRKFIKKEMAHYFDKQLHNTPSRTRVQGAVIKSSSSKWTPKINKSTSSTPNKSDNFRKKKH